MIAFTKAHAYGNDFLYVPAAALSDGDPAVWARALCDRHRGIGADGVILYTLTSQGATMRLLNADGSPSELSGNGLRGLAAIVAREWRRTGRDDERDVIVETTAGVKRLVLEDVAGTSYLFAAEMGSPTGIAERRLDVAGETVTATVLAVGIRRFPIARTSSLPRWRRPGASGFGSGNAASGPPSHRAPGRAPRPWPRPRMAAPCGTSR
jgi:diaminopimelate epimerase